MDLFTTRNALQTGVDLIRRRPRLIGLWASLLLAQTVCFAVVRAMLPAGGHNGALLAYDFATAGLSLVLAALLWASAFRALLRLDDPKPLAFGKEELWLFGSWVIIQLIVQISTAALSFVLVSGFGAPAQVAAFAGMVLGVVGLSWSAVASAWAFDRRQVELFRYGTIAGGQVWLLACLVVGLAVLDRLVSAAVHLLGAPLGGSAPRLRDVLQAPALLQDVLTAAFGALEITFIAGVVACGYRAEAAPDPHAAIFSKVSGETAS
jgi:hypothetical protein